MKAQHASGQLAYGTKQVEMIKVASGTPNLNAGIGAPVTIFPEGGQLSQDESQSSMISYVGGNPNVARQDSKTGIIQEANDLLGVLQNRTDQYKEEAARLRDEIARHKGDINTLHSFDPQPTLVATTLPVADFNPTSLPSTSLLQVQGIATDETIDCNPLGLSIEEPSGPPVALAPSGLITVPIVQSREVAL